MRRSFLINLGVFACFMGLVLLDKAIAATPERDPYPLTTEDRKFFTRVKDAILHDNKKWLADHISLPLFVDTQPQYVKTKKEFLRRYDEIINSRVREATQQQKADELFKNWQGVMIGNGEIWLNQLGEPGSNSDNGPWTYYIVTINNQP